MNDNGNSNAEMIKQYRRYLKLGRNYSENTLKAYMDDLQKLLNYANCEGLALTEVKLDDHCSCTYINPNELMTDWG